MLEIFTDRARKVMILADQEAQRFNHEAQRFNHEYIGTEHILIGLIKEGGGVGIIALKNLGLNLMQLLMQLRSEIERKSRSGSDMIIGGKLPQTPLDKQVIEFAVEEARSLNHNYVGTEHLLLGLLRVDESLLGLKLEDVRVEVLSVLGAGTKEEKPVKSTCFHTNKELSEKLTEFFADGKEYVDHIKLGDGSDETNKIIILYRDSS